MKQTTISPVAVAKIETLDQLLQHTYQMTKRLIDAMEFEQCKNLFTDLQRRIEHIYIKVNMPGVRPNDFSALMSGLKKLEVIYGYFFDRMNSTTFMEVR